MNSRVEKAKKWIDEISSHNSQDLDRILFFMNLLLTKRDLYYENVRLEKEIEKLHSIIKEAREYIRNNSENFDEDLCTGDYFELKDIVEILDKAGDK